VQRVDEVLDQGVEGLVGDGESRVGLGEGPAREEVRATEDLGEEGGRG
jgi:hypothetical protein